MRWLLLGVLMMGAVRVTALASAVDGPVQIYGYALEYRLREAGDTQYNLLFAELAQQGLKFTLIIQPFPRVIRDIAQHRGCVFPTSLNAMQIGAPKYSVFKFIASDAVDFISLRILTAADQPVIHQLQELSGKRIGVWDGLDTNILLKNVDAVIEPTPNELVRLRMLNKGRLDAILGFTPDVSLVSQRLGLPVPQYDRSLAIFNNEGASLLCHDTPANREFLQQFNTRLQQMKTNGQLRDILGPYADLAP